MRIPVRALERVGQRSTGKGVCVGRRRPPTEAGAEAEAVGPLSDCTVVVRLKTTANTNGRLLLRTATDREQLRTENPRLRPPPPISNPSPPRPPEITPMTSSYQEETADEAGPLYFGGRLEVPEGRGIMPGGTFAVYRSYWPGLGVVE